MNLAVWWPEFPRTEVHAKPPSTESAAFDSPDHEELCQLADLKRIERVIEPLAQKLVDTVATSTTAVGTIGVQGYFRQIRLALTKYRLPTSK